MRRAFRILAALAILIGLCSHLHAQVPLTGAGKGAPGGGGFTPSCSQSSTFLAAATGVTLPADKMNYDTLICGLVSDGVWNFDALYIWAAPSGPTALINLANPGTFNGTLNGITNFSNFVNYQGFTGDGSTFYIDSGFNPSTATSPNFVQNSATVGVYVLTARTTSSNFWEVGCAAAGCNTALGPSFALLQSGGFNTQLNSAASGPGGANSNTQGAWNLTRTTSTHSVALSNSSESGNSSTDTSSGVENGNILFFTFLTVFGWTGEQMAAGWIGAGVGSDFPGSGVNSCKINNRINTYLGFLQGQATDQRVYSNSAC